MSNGELFFFHQYRNSAIITKIPVPPPPLLYDHQYFLHLDFIYFIKE